MVTTTAERAREEADACDAAAAEGRWLGLLHGMPVALKDNIETAGVRTTSGATYLADHIPNSDAPVVGRLKAQGAVLIGKANMQELAWGVVSTNPVVGPVPQPVEPGAHPGWLQRRLRRRGRGGDGRCCARHRHRRLGADSGLDDRHRGPAPHPRAHLDPRHHARQRRARYRGPHGAHRGGRRAPLRRARRLRPARPGLARSAAGEFPAPAG